MHDCQYIISIENLLLSWRESAPGASYTPGQETISENVTLTYKIK